MIEENIDKTTEETITEEINEVKTSNQDKFKTFLLSFWNVTKKILVQPDRHDLSLSGKEQLGFLVLYFIIMFLYLQATPRALFQGRIKLTIGMGMPALFSLIVLALQVGMYLLLAFIKERKYASFSQAIIAMFPMYLILLIAILVGSFSFIASIFISVFGITAYLTNLGRLTTRSSYYGELLSSILFGLILGGMIVFSLVFLTKKATIGELGIDISTFTNLLQ